MAIISVIIPVHNSESTLIRCVESIQGNDWKDFEIILIEDGSRDSSWEMCRQLSQKYDNIRSIKNEKNMGVSYTRNRGLDTSTGKFIMFVDSDDWVEPDYFSSFMEELESDSHILVVCGFINHDEKYHHRTDEYTWSGSGSTCYVDKENSLHALYEKVLLFQLWNKVFLTSVIKERNLRFDESISIGEDFRFILSYLQFADAQRIAVLDRPLYHYMRDQEGSLMMHVEHESMEEALINIKLLYGLEGYSDEEIAKKLTFERKRYMESHAYMIMHSAALGSVEKKRLILDLDAGSGKSLYKRHKRLMLKEQVVGMIHKFKK